MELRMTNDIIKYLRELALKCAHLARDCPHVDTAHGLEEISVSLMEKASELQQLGGE